MFFFKMAFSVIVLLLLLTTVLVKNSGSVETYSLSFSYFDEIAQSYCAARSHGHVFAVRRNCEGVAPTCNEICKSVKDEAIAFLGNGHTKAACFDAIHVYKLHPVLKANPGGAQPDDRRLGLSSYGYGESGCIYKPDHCGPNFCCCKSI